MQYVRPVDYGAFRPTEFHSQRIGDDKSEVGSCVLILTRVPPGKRTPGHHVHTGDQFYFILDGDMNIHMGDKHYTATKDDLVFIPCGVPHHNWNSTDKDEVHFEFVVPAPPPTMSFAYRMTETDDVPTRVDDPYYIRRLDRTKFDPKRLSQVTLADFSTGSRHSRIDMARLPAGQADAGMHVHAFDRVFYTIEGTLSLMIGAEENTVVKDSYVILPAGVPHSVSNKGREAAMWLDIQVPEHLVPSADVPLTLNP